MSSSINRRTALATLGASLALASGLSAAQSFPTKTIRILIGAAAGGSDDPFMRVMIDKLGTVLGQGVVLEHKAGATGVIAMDALTKAAPDGHTLALMWMPHTIQPAVLSPMPYDTVKDIAPVIQLAWGYNVLIANKDAPFNSVQEMIAYARANPGKVAFGSGGNTTPAHLAGEYLKRLAKVDMLHVPYRGLALAIPDLLAGRIQIIIGATGAALPLIRGNQVKAFATTAPERMRLLPNVPTFAEAGFDMPLRDWRGIVAPARTPRAIIERLNTEIGKIITNPEFLAQVDPQGMIVAGGSAENLSALIGTDMARWANLVKEAGIKAD